MRAPILLFLALTATRGAAQASTGSADPPTDTSASSTSSTSSTPASARPQIGSNSLFLMGGAVGAGLAVSLFDSRLLSGAQHWGNQASWQRASAIGNIVGGPGPIALGALLYATGRGTGNTFVTNTGREVMRAVLVSGALTAATKGVVGRARPTATPGDPDEYRPGHGFLNDPRASFPSGHTSAAFATATVLARELDAAHPRARWIVDPLLFGGASFIGLSRVYDRQHWPSDVLVGAALGTITGYEVVAHAHGQRSPIGTALFSHLHLGPQPHGVAVGWSLR